MLKYEWLARLLSDIERYAALHDMAELSTLLGAAVTALAKDTGVDARAYRTALAEGHKAFSAASPLKPCPGTGDCKGDCSPAQRKVLRN
ncbi:hypothetical protein LAZ29_03230 [Cereibacter sphaeroides]|uniref:hypothetical protein n=1 Tax=Cereibacter sphaeroides TaxID=1063 RepID=UPI001F1FC042|nr:hypothetical protein [Cereibacter sphaeroides]MCE6949936.1 hypothetical protein [Cereibacter sphaeroides]